MTKEEDEIMRSNSATDEEVKRTAKEIGERVTGYMRSLGREGDADSKKNGKKSR